MRIDAARLHERLAALARVGRDPRGGVSRLAYTEADREARALVTDWMCAAGLDVRVDTAANIYGRRAGTIHGLRPLVFGSHVDSVPNGGDFDGPLGTIAAIEVAQTLADHGAGTRHPLEVVVWSNEEGGLYGSRAASGMLPAQESANVSAAGCTVAEGIAFLGGDPARLGAARLERGSIAGYLELHIEQGEVLESTRTQIGVVEGIVAIWQWDVTIVGRANHAGTTPMDRRQDALLAAARFIEMVNRVVRAEPGHPTGTVGRIEASPGAPNAIAGHVRCSLELRDMSVQRLARLFERIRAEAATIGGGTGTTFEFGGTISTKPAPCDPAMQEAISAAARVLGLTTRAMPSGAGHDAQEMARLGPTGMIFIPSVGGVSHSPQEFSRPEDVTNGAAVLLGAVLRADELLDGDCEPAVPQ